MTPNSTQRQIGPGDDARPQQEMRVLGRILRLVDRLATPLSRRGFLFYFGMAAVLMVLPFPKHQAPNPFPIILATLYGVYRGIVFHPARSRAYLRWLMATPWSPGRRPPFAPQGLLPHDFVLMALLVPAVLLAWPRSLAVTCVALLIPYLVVQTAMLMRLSTLKPQDLEPARTLQSIFTVDLSQLLLRIPFEQIPGRAPRLNGAMLLVGWGALVLSAFHGIFGVLAIAALMLPVVWIGNRTALNELWYDLTLPVTFRGPEILPPGNRELAGRADYGTMSWADALIWCAVAGWYAYVLRELTLNLDPPLGLIFVPLVVAMVLLRAGVYLSGVRPPVGFLTRLSTGRLFLPDYDVVWVAPLLVAGCAAAAYFALRDMDHQLLPFAGAVSGLLLVTLKSGPSLRTWRLTGGHAVIRRIESGRVSTRPVRSAANGATRKANLDVSVPALQRLLSTRTYFDRYIASQMTIWLVSLPIAGLLTAVAAPRGREPGSAPIFLASLPFWATALAMVLSTPIARVRAFHPFARWGYLDWLAATHWEPSRPLPLGPVHLVWRDVLIFLMAAVTPLCAILAALQPSQLPSPRAMLLVSTGAVLLTFGMYIFGLGRLLFLTGQREIAIVLVASVGVLMLAFPNIPLVFCSMAGAYLLAFWGLRRSLAGFPWQAERQWLTDYRNRMTGLLTSDTRRAGVLPSFLSGKEEPWLLTMRERALMILVGGWLLFCFLPLTPAGETPLECWLFGSGIVAVGFIVRIIVYYQNLDSPMGFWARLLTRRWVISGHDRGLLTPLLAVLAWVASGFVTGGVGLPLAVGLPVSAMISFAILVFGKPSLAEWRLTGQFRLQCTNKPAGGAFIRLG